MHIRSGVEILIQIVAISSDTSFDLSDYIDNCTSFSDLALEYQLLVIQELIGTLVGETLTDDINVITHL